MKIYKSVRELIGRTPLVELGGVEKKYGLSARLIAKVEAFNPAGSVKDRVALNIIEEMQKEGSLTPDTTIIEPTSGNTGIGICAVCATMGLRAIIVMPSTMSPERVRLMRAYGAEVVLTDGAGGMSLAVEKARELAESIPNSVIAGQFENPANPIAHIKTTAPEIWEDTDGNIDVFVAGIGTGGTVSGVGKYLKEKNGDIRIVGVEPKSSPLITKGRFGSHKLQGIGANFIPDTLDTGVVDEVICVSDEDAVAMTRELAKGEGILVGISSGAAVCAAVELAKREEYENKSIVVLLPDTGARYLSGDTFAD